MARYQTGMMALRPAGWTTAVGYAEYGYPEGPFSDAPAVRQFVPVVSTLPASFVDTLDNGAVLKHLLRQQVAQTAKQGGRYRQDGRDAWIGLDWLDERQDGRLGGGLDGRQDGAGLDDSDEGALCHAARPAAT